MKKIIFAFLIILYVQSAFAQNTTIAKLKFESAEESFSEGKYEACIQKLEEAEKLFTKSNPPISHLKILSIDKLLDEDSKIKNINKRRSIELLALLIKEYDLYMKNYASLSGAEDKTREVFKIQEKYESEMNKFRSMPGFLTLVSGAQKGNVDAAFKLGELYEKEDMDGRALHWYIKSADKDHEASMLKVYDLRYRIRYVEGHEKESTYAFGKKYLNKAIENGNLKAMIIYADNLRGGYDDTPKDLNAAIEWYLKVLAKGQTEVLTKLGYSYYEGLDYKNAFLYHTKAIENGHAGSYYGLAIMYIDGNGVERNYAKAMEYYKILQDKYPNSAGPYFSIGDLYKYGFGVEKNYMKALEFYQRGLDKDKYYENQFADEAGVLYFEGGYGLAQDYGKALKYFKFDESLQNFYYLGQVYEKGLGVSRDYTVAMDWYKKAVNEDHTGAMRCIGNMYEKGLGVSQNYATAMEWYVKAVNNIDDNSRTVQVYFENGWDAKMDKAEAMHRIGQLYEKGLGVKKDKIIAQEWYQKAEATKTK